MDNDTISIVHSITKLRAICSVDNPQGRRMIDETCVHFGTSYSNIKNGKCQDKEVLENIWNKIQHIR